MHTPLGMGLPPDNFLTPEMRKLAKNLAYFGWYRRDLLGELHQTFVLDAPLRGIKCPHLILGVEKLGRKTTPLRLYCRYLQIGTRYRRLENDAAYSNLCLMNFGPQTEKMGPFFSPLKINFFGRSYFRGWEAFPLKISQLVKDNQRLLTLATSSGTGLSEQFF